MVEVAKDSEAKLSGHGNIIYITKDEVKDTNFRLLHEDAEKNRPWFIRGEESLDLFFFRQMFTKLKLSLRQRSDDHHLIPGEDDAADEIIPVEVFQRAFERLLFILRDPLDSAMFDAKEYDENGNGFVGWAEFCYVYKNRKPTIRLSMTERIFLTFEQQESSILAKIVSMVMLLTIMVSSLCFVLSTVEECRDPPEGDDPPRPMEFFAYIEYVCLTIFVIDYATRLATCWAVRAEVLEKQELLDLASGHNQIILASAPQRFVNFLVKPANLIDLVAILPSLVELVTNPSGEGGSGFVVLRLVRLTRVLRVFKDPKIKEPVEVIETTIRKSTKALYVLGFNLLLGIVIFGSLMWVVEQGQWNPETQTFQRDVWSGDEHMYVPADSPFRSIPHSFWWAIVTATTVGYGDHFPVTSQGYMVAVATMLYSLVIGALPVGVIGGTFSNVWEEYEKNRKVQQAAAREERAKITRAIEKISPTKLRNLMLIEVWNERFVTDKAFDAWGVEQKRPNCAEFMGQAKIELELGEEPTTEPIELKLELEANPELVSRPASGHIIVKYTWEPNQIVAPASPMGSASRKSRRESELDPFSGKLTVSLIGGAGLLNLNLHSKSNPFALAFCYPNSPSDSKDTIQPVVWRSPTMQATLAPEWNAKHCFDFRWYDSERKYTDAPTHDPLSKPDPPAKIAVAPCPGDVPNTLTDGRLNEALDGLLSMKTALLQELERVKDEVKKMDNKVARIERDRALPGASARPFPPSPDLISETELAQ